MQYAKIATRAAQNERNKYWYEAMELWEQAAEVASNKNNQLWANARSKACEKHIMQE